MIASSYLVGGPGGICLGEELLVHAVDGGKVVDVLQEDGRLDHVAEVGSGGAQDLAHVLQGLTGLRLHAAAHDLHGRRLEADLAGDVEGLVHQDGLGGILHKLNVRTSEKKFNNDKQRPCHVPTHK